MATGWNLWVWLQCIGVVSGCCCKEVIIITFPYSTCTTLLALIIFEHSKYLNGKFIYFIPFRYVEHGIFRFF